MSEFKIYSKEQAEEILKLYENCSICANCKINSPEGWRCSHIKEQAEKYLKEHKE